jgi:hypothetical protein
LLVLLSLIGCFGVEEVESSKNEAAPSPEARVKGIGRPRPQSVSYPAGEFFRHAQRLRISGEAVGTVDIDGDGWTDLLVVDGTRFASLLRNFGASGGTRRFLAKRFPVASEGEGWGYSAKGMGLHDLNNDGLMDFYLSVSLKNKRPGRGADERPAGGYSTLINQGGGRFTPMDLAIDSAGYKRTALFSDLDRDGYTDVYVSNSAYYGDAWVGKGEPNILVPGTAEGFGSNRLEAMESATKDFWIGEDGRTRKNFKGAVIRDFDGDGLGDLVTGSLADIWAKKKYDLTTAADPGYQGSWDRGVYVFHNRSTPGNLRFAEVSHDAIENAYGVTDQPHVHAVVPGDYDLDGDFDLILAGYKGISGHNTLEKNTAILRYFENISTPGHLRFRERTEEAGFAEMNGSVGVPGPYPIRYQHLGTEVVLYPSLLAGASLDIDNDGDLDFVAIDRQVTRVNPQTNRRIKLHSWLFLNTGSGTFERQEAERSGLWGTARDLSYGDFNRDGKLDLVTVDGSGGGQSVSNATDIFMNVDPNTNRYLGLQVSLPEDAFGIGTSVRVLEPGTGKLLGYDELRTDFCYRSKRDARLHFGLGEQERVDLALRLNDGRELRINGLETNAVYRVLLRDWEMDSSGAGLHILGTQADQRLGAEVGDPVLDGQAVGPLSRADVNGDGIDDWVLKGAKVTAGEASTLYANSEDLKLIFLRQGRDSEGR